MRTSKTIFLLGTLIFLATSLAGITVMSNDVNTQRLALDHTLNARDEFKKDPVSYCKDYSECTRDSFTDSCLVFNEECVNNSNGYKTEYGDFIPHSCERTWANSDEIRQGLERFIVHTGPDHKSVCELLNLADCYSESDASSETMSWRKPMIKIDYSKNHEVCVYNMPGNKTRCFDLYEMGER